MDRKMFIGVALVGLLLSFVYLPVAHATMVESSPSVSDINIQIFNFFTVNIEPSTGASVIYADSGLSLGSALLIDQITSLDGSSLQYIEEPPIVPAETHQIDSLTMSNPVSVYASVFNVTIFNFDYSAGGSSGRVTALRFEVNNEDHRMIAISAFSENDIALFWLWYQDSATNTHQVFGDWVRISGSYTLAEGYHHLSHVMSWASNNIYAGSNDVCISALERAYLKMAYYSQFISHELTVNPALSPFNKQVQNSLALLLDPTYYMSTNWWLRLTIKSAIYTAATALLTQWYNPKVVLITTAALVAALAIISPALAPDIFGLAFATTAVVIHIEAGRLPWWLGWLRPILEGIAWAFENIGSIISFGAVWKYKSYLWTKTFLWTMGIWLIIDFAVEHALDHFNLLRDY